jgi:L-ascorbate metabolism protein UlaG (beta-lactamase superfamily)
MVYFDPFGIREKTHDADVILITHEHYDHFSPEDIAKIAKPDMLVAVPEGMKAKARKELPSDCRILTVKPGAKYEMGKLVFETVPAYNRLKPFHPKSSGWVGYLLKTGEETVYVAGDTDATVEAAQVRCDIALVPIGGTYTMNAKQAAELINTIQPAVAIPTHYGSIVGSRDDAEIFVKNVDPSITVEIKIA